MTGSDVAYSTAGLRAGGSRALAAADAAEEALGHLLGAVAGTGDFGAVDLAPAVASGLSSARDGYARSAASAGSRHREVDARATSTGNQGDELVAGTTRIAGSVVAGMR